MCPFHNDVNPSMKLNLGDGSFYCFGCAVSGNAIDFVKLAESEMNDLQAGIEYYKILKSDKVKHIDMSGRQPKRKAGSKHLWNVAHDYYYGLKAVDWADVSSESEEEYIRTLEYMEGRGFTADVLTTCKAKVTYNRSYPIIFPMMDNGMFKGWVCRTTDKRMEARRKYLYNEGFSRARTLVGDYEGKKTVVMVEGYMDRLKLVQFGVENAVAILGWKITAEQVEKLKRAGVKNVISALDNDEPGRKGTEFLKQFFRVKRFKFEPGCKDPGMMTKDSFARMMKNTKQAIK